MKLCLSKIFLFIFIFSSMLSGTSAQIGDTQISRNSLEEAEVREFIGAFEKHLNVSMDIEKVPQRFFADDFRFDLLPFDFDFLVDKQLVGTFTADENRRFRFVIFNSFYIGFAQFLGKVDLDEDIELEESTIKSIERIFPAHIVRMVKNSGILMKLIKEEDNEKKEPKITSVVEMSRFINELRSLGKEMRVYLRNRPSEDLPMYNKNAVMLRSAGSYYVKQCRRDWEGIAPKTRIILLSNGLFRYTIVKRNGVLKIHSFQFDIYF